MKKIIIIFLFVLLCSVTAVPCEAKIHKGKTKTGITYRYNTKNKTLTISGKIVRMDGKWGTDSEKKAPWDKWYKKAEKLVFKKGVRTITNGAFSTFIKVKKIVFPKTLKKIREGAFMDTQIEKLELPDSVTEIGYLSFRGDTYNGRIKEMKLPSKLRKIGVDAFSYQTALTEVTIPRNVTSIGKNAFRNCSGLKTVIIKSTKIKEVGLGAFRGLAENAVIYVPQAKEKEYRKLLWGFDGLRGLRIEVLSTTRRGIREMKGMREVFGRDLDWESCVKIQDC